MPTEPVIVGVDEAGRGPLAGPVVAAAVVLDTGPQSIAGLTDSKKLGAVRRERLEIEIKHTALDWAVGIANVEEIDDINILQATFLAMRRAVSGLSLRPTQVLVDGNQNPGLKYPTTTIVKGDLSEPCISAASILAKQARDRIMVELDEIHPGYGFAQHKGYPTKSHREAISALGVTEVHRRSFKPVRALL